jgi:hypothetical protein
MNGSRGWSKAIPRGGPSESIGRGQAARTALRVRVDEHPRDGKRGHGRKAF